MSDDRTPIILVGSVHLRDEQEVFSAVSGTLGDRIRAIADGETGERTNWIHWQKSVLDQAPMLEKRKHVEDYVDRMCGVWGKSVSARVHLGGRRINTKHNVNKAHYNLHISL